MKQAVILAGGKGTRLRERLGGLPKPLIDVCGVPLLARQVELAKRHGFTDVLILVNHAAERIVDYVASNGAWGLNVECIDDGEPRGTAGATLACFDRLAEEFLVVYGDTMLEVDLSRFHAWHAQRPENVAALFLHPNDHPHDSDLVEIDDADRVTAFHPYPHDGARYFPNLVNAALYWVRRQALEPWRRETAVLDFGKDLFPAMLRRGMVLGGYRSPEYIKDIGTPTRLDRVCDDFRSGKIERASLGRAQPVVFLDRDGTINREANHLRHPDQLELLPGAAEAIRRLNRSDYRCCVVTNQPVIARGECTEEGLRQIHNKLETLLGQGGAFVDRIYHCPHHPDGGYPGERPELKIECDCRKPNTGLIDKAARDLNVARDRSWLIGDGSVDIEAARRAGLRSILVESGQAGLDYRTWATPDFVVPGLPEAVTLILDQYPRLLSGCAAWAAEIGAGALVLIGGQARSGKSSFGSVLRDAIRSRGSGAVLLSADRWLKSGSDRGPGVFGRYDMPALQELVHRLGGARPAQLALPGYHKLKRERIEAVETLTLAPGDVVLVEGVVALALEAPPGMPDLHRFHVDLDEGERQVRILREYRLRGHSEDEARRVYEARRDDEFDAIEGLAARARRLTLEAL